MLPPGAGRKVGEHRHLRFQTHRPITGAMKAKDYVVRPWSQEEEEDFQRFCDSIGKLPDDPAHAEAMQDGAVVSAAIVPSACRVVHLHRGE